MTARVVISPAMKAMPVVTSVSHATRLVESCERMASRIESEIWSAILSGCPSVTDSDVNRCRPLRLMQNAPSVAAGGPAGAGRSGRAHVGGQRRRQPETLWVKRLSLADQGRG